MIVFHLKNKSINYTTVHLLELLGKLDALDAKIVTIDAISMFKDEVAWMRKW